MQVVLKAGKIDFFVSSLPKILFVPFYFDKEVQCSKVQILTFNKPTIIKKKHCYRVKLSPSLGNPGSDCSHNFEF